MTLENLIALRNTLFSTITNLQMGLMAEKKKADECEFFRNDKNFDTAAMDAQAERSLENVKEIQKVLDMEAEKLNELNKQIDGMTKIINAHGSHPCLMGSVPHTWNVLARHQSGKFAHRVCTVCSTSEKVGYC